MLVYEAKAVVALIYGNIPFSILRIMFVLIFYQDSYAVHGPHGMRVSVPRPSVTARALRHAVRRVG